jgi:hypothetical protein
MVVSIDGDSSQFTLNDAGGRPITFKIGIEHIGDWLGD